MHLLEDQCVYTKTETIVAYLSSGKSTVLPPPFTPLYYQSTYKGVILLQNLKRFGVVDDITGIFRRNQMLKYIFKKYISYRYTLYLQI